jgi:hypothetical protein
MGSNLNIITKVIIPSEWKEACGWKGPLRARRELSAGMERS